MLTLQVAVAPNVEMNLQIESVLPLGKSGFLALPLGDASQLGLIERGQKGVLRFTASESKPVRIAGLERKEGRLQILCKAGKA